MFNRYPLIGTLLLWLFVATAHGQIMQGQIIDASTGKPLDDVNVLNIHTQSGMMASSDGSFNVSAASGQLIEFRKVGYKIIRVRIPNGKLPPYFKVGMERSAVQLPTVEVNGIAKDYKSDSERYHAMYKQALEFPEMSTAQMMRSPFSAFSKRNRQIWEFQKEFEMFQQQKYIDYTFNEKLVEKITGLRGDSATAYVKMFRPSYEQLRSMNEYTYFTYIKRTVMLYRERGQRARMGQGRGTQ
ncbi:MAG: hypothetical protein EOP56_04550 [Sphingobacteriales bacterium]|nr:MAG: hypothetical protein EOP56_04550 [Sphingobacteriales bacterium]